MPIIINEDLQNNDFDLVFTNQAHTVVNFAIDYGDVAVYFNVSLRGPSCLSSHQMPFPLFVGLFAQTIVRDNWKIETIRFSTLEKLLNSCPKDQIAALSESLLTQFKAYEPDLIQVPIRSQMESLLRSYIPTEAPERNLA